MSTQSELQLRCRCGKVRGVVHEASHENGNRLVCLCVDCQAFAAFLERPDVIDTYGGSDIYQMAPARMKITEGADQLRSMRLSEKGMLRWYTDCCKTPVGNTVNGKIPFVGLIVAFTDPDLSPSAPDEILGKPIGYMNAPDAKKLPPEIVLGSKFKILGRVSGLMLKWWIGGKASPSPFFDAKTREPIRAPKILSRAERDLLPHHVNDG